MTTPTFQERGEYLGTDTRHSGRSWAAVAALATLVGLVMTLVLVMLPTSSDAAEALSLEPNRSDEDQPQLAVDQAVGALESYSYANGTSFKLSSSLPMLADPPLPRADEVQRWNGVDQMVDALESYGLSNGTYLVDGSGYRGRGSGWGFYEAPGGNYPVSVASRLQAEGHLSDDVTHDELWVNERSIAGDVLVYRCKNRVAVFTREGNGAPSASDSDWWTDNGCNRYPIDGLNATYFKLSDALPSLPDPPLPRAD